MEPDQAPEECPAETERLPFWVVRDGEGYRLKRKQVWAWAIAFPFLWCALTSLSPVLLLRAHQFDASFYTRMGYTSARLGSLMLGFSVAMALRQERAIKQGKPRLPWHQFSLLELLVITTGFACSFAVFAMHQRWLAGQN